MHTCMVCTRNDMHTNILTRIDTIRYTRMPCINVSNLQLFVHSICMHASFTVSYIVAFICVPHPPLHCMLLL